MAKKSDDSASLMAHGESFENAAWLANMRIAIEKRGLFEPTDGEIQKMRAKIGDSPLFAKLSDTNKAELFRVMLTVRLKLETYDRLSKFEQEHIAGLLRVLGDFVATIPRHHGLLSVVADGISEISVYHSLRSVGGYTEIRRDDDVDAYDSSEDRGPTKSLR